MAIRSSSSDSPSLMATSSGFFKTSRPCVVKGFSSLSSQVITVIASFSMESTRVPFSV
eukprot:CAMPEP_0170621892 /NCGR_PEP_ID=MMETSP0224-20130122/28840_1 /TAXON_ID=285029 /ORGANISM="Togula jolla, Strain CCCM 725" /LENGTH=57 /DNA_ID=CAMNT_0010948175 /DNA_START=342 /DNA_END=511 /DNA_ORIENTATION=-